MASTCYTSVAFDCFKGNIDFDVDTFKMMLVQSGYTVNKDHTKRSDVTNECPATGGYTTGGGTFGVAPFGAAPTITHDTANDRVEIAFGDGVWSTSTITARGAVIYKSRGGAASADELVCYIDFGADYSTAATEFRVVISPPMRILNP